MIPISPALKAAFNPNDGDGGRQIDFAVRFAVVNEDARGEAASTAAEDTQISRMEQLFNNNADALDYITFEEGGWPLDGSKVIPPRPGELPDAEIGLVMPELSDSDGLYASPQSITATTLSSYNLLALTLNFSHAPAADFELLYYNGATLLDTYAVTGNGKNTFVAAHAVENVNKVVLSITRSALPHHRVRLAEWVYGVNLDYDKTNSDSLDLNEVADPFNERVPTGDMRLVVDNFARDFDIFDETGIYAFFRDRQVMSPKIGALTDVGAWGYVPKGKRYLQRPKLSGNLSKLELKAVDLRGLLQETIYSMGVYKTATLAAFTDDVAADAGITVTYPASFSSITVSAYIPTVSHAEAFRLIAQAGNALLTVDAAGELAMLAVDDTVLQTLSQYDYRMTNGFSPSDEDIINTVAVEVAQLTVAAAAEKLAEATGAGTHEVKYDPSTAQSATITGGSITGAVYCADNAVLTITGGTVTINGKKITAVRTVKTATIAQPNERRYVYEMKGNQFIQAANADAVAAYMLALKANRRKSVKLEYRGYPYLEMGDTVDFNAGGSNTPPYIVTKNSLRLAGGMTGTLEARECPG